MKKFDRVIITETGEIGKIIEIDTGEDIEFPVVVKFNDSIHCYDFNELELDV